MDKEIWKKPLRQCNIGGEALIEGVMMRGNDKMAMAVRKSNGEIVVQTFEQIPVAKKFFLFKLPIIRGAVNMIESMVIGMKALMTSAEEIDIEEEEESKFDKFLKKIFGDNMFRVMLYFSVVIALVFGIGIFMLLPNWIAGWFAFDKSTPLGSISANLIEGALRVVIFISYIFLVSKNKEIKRVFEYHGAEHSAIYAYENKEELTTENAKSHTTLHPRCGTTYLFVVIITSILLFSFIRWRSPLINMAIRLALLPLVAGIAYEVFKLAAKTGFKPLRAISYPGLLLQKITTQPPDESQLEVALAALKAVAMPEDNPEDETESEEEPGPGAGEPENEEEPGPGEGGTENEEEPGPGEDGTEDKKEPKPGGEAV